MPAQYLNLLLTTEEWDSLIQTRKQLPRCCDKMDNLLAVVRSCKYVGGGPNTYHSLIGRYNLVCELHDMSMFPVLTKLIDFAKDQIRVEEAQNETDAQEFMEYAELFGI